MLVIDSTKIKTHNKMRFYPKSLQYQMGVSVFLYGGAAPYINNMLLCMPSNDLKVLDNLIKFFVYEA